MLTLEEIVHIAGLLIVVTGVAIYLIKEKINNNGLH